MVACIRYVLDLRSAAVCCGFRNTLNSSNIGKYTQDKPTYKIVSKIELLVYMSGLHFMPEDKITISKGAFLFWFIASIVGVFVGVIATVFTDPFIGNAIWIVSGASLVWAFVKFDRGDIR